ncbi:hypothetical protein SALBM311S_00303 [Streptomyces alboniger]
MNASTAAQGLAFARLDQEAAARCEPAGCLCDDPAQDVQAVRAAVEGEQRLVFACLGGQQPDLVGGDVRHVGREDVDPAAQVDGQRLEQVAGVDVAADFADIAAGTTHRRRFDVGRVQFDGAERGGQRGTDRARTTAQVHDDGRVRDVGERPLDEELGTATGHEDAGFHRDAQSAELCPSQDEFERQAGHPAVHQVGQFVRGAGGGQDQLRLVLGEDTTGAPQCGNGTRRHGTTARRRVG